MTLRENKTDIRKGKLVLIITGFLALLAIVRLVFFPDRPPTLNAANGVYRNSACGQVVLQDGVMGLSNGHVAYHGTYQKNSNNGGLTTALYIIPDNDVGFEESAQGCHTVTFPLKKSFLIRFATEGPNPSIKLHNEKYTSALVFERVP